MHTRANKPNRKIRDYKRIVRPRDGMKRKRELIERMLAEKRRREEAK